MIQLGCCAFSLALGLKDALRLVSYLGFRVADVGASSPTSQVNQAKAAAEPAETAKTIRELANRYELNLGEFFLTGIHVDGREVQVNDPDARLRDRLLEEFRGLCQCAAGAGFKSVMGVPGRHQEALGDEGSFDTAADMLARMVKIAQESGIAFHVEPASSSILGTPEAALRMAREVPGLRYTLDYAHYIGQGYPQDEVMPLNEFAGHLHGKPARPGYAKAFVENNAIDFRAIIQDLRDREWNGIISLECIGRPSDDPAIPHPIYQEIAHPGGPLPPVRGMVSHPVYQALQLARELEEILD